MVKPHDSGDVSQAWKLQLATSLTTVIAILFVGLRLYVRMFMVKLLGWDDLWNVLALATALATWGLVEVALNHGIGRHIAYLEPASFSYGVKMLRVGEFMLIMTTVSAKVSIALFLKRLFLTSKVWKWFLWIYIAFNSITSTLDAALIFPQCTPVEYNWNKGIKGHCWSNDAINAVGITQGTIAAATDFILSILPLVFLWTIQIPWKVKIGIWCVMAIGFASGSFAIARTVLVPSLTATHDPTWDLIPLFTWAVLESNFNVIAAAAPSVKPLFSGKPGWTNRSKSKSKSKTHDVALGDVTGSRRSWLRSKASKHSVMDITVSDDKNIRDSISDDVKPWPLGNSGIVRTTDVHISREDGRMNPVQLPERSSEEALVPERSYGMIGYDSRI
ncbi:Hypothetical protein R9X50_00617800 [Acrodontium crateriforme]|uniref:Rhodopsin domain-containing protein n=1 Tax=Acrodontium crateriforme TaxID=150365 RepID=A0AAQ3RBG1_9PEZI|nr:Hypothetical protein R9X50_00617800 [Acrodontium crateriforme]